MSNILLRGLPENIRQWVHECARKEDFSANQLFYRLIQAGLEDQKRSTEKLQRRREAVRRINERREILYQKYGLFEDSTSSIRQDRESH